MARPQKSGDPIYFQAMKFAPEYVSYVLNENFEDAKAFLLSASGFSSSPNRWSETRTGS